MLAPLLCTKPSAHLCLNYPGESMPANTLPAQTCGRNLLYTHVLDTSHLTTPLLTSTGQLWHVPSVLPPAHQPLMTSVLSEHRGEWVIPPQRKKWIHLYNLLQVSYVS